MELVRNLETNEIGIIVKHCKKTVKVCVLHKAIQGAHSFKYWKKYSLSTKSSNAKP